MKKLVDDRFASDEHVVRATARMLSLTVPGRPITWKRPKGHGGGYTDSHRAKAQLRTLKAYILEASRQTGIHYPEGEPVSARLHFHFEGLKGGFTAIELFPYCVPWSAPRSRLYGDVSTFEATPSLDRIDVDNLSKLVLEAATKAGVVADDSQFVYVSIWKTGSTRKRK